MSKTNNKKVYVETDNINNIMSEMDNKCDELIHALDTSLDKVNETKKVFDTPTSMYFREKAEEFIEEEKLYIKNDILPLIELLGELSKIYQEEDELEKSIVSSKKNDGGSNNG